jgi:hypothetical protein
VLFRKRKNGDSGAAVAEPRSELLEARQARHRAGAELVAAPGGSPEFPEPASELPAVGEVSRVPEATREELTPEVLRGSLLEYGCLLVRGLVPREDAEAMAAGIERAYAVREEVGEGGSDGDLYDELQAEPPYSVLGRPFVAKSGGMFAVDSPRLQSQMFELFAAAGVDSLVEGYLGERPLVSAEKCTLRKTTADLPSGWHQDGKFLTDVRAINLWLALSRCGDVAPGLDIVPKRFDSVLETTPIWVEDHAGPGQGAMVDLGFQGDDVTTYAGDTGITRPIFEPGDALLFDELCLHSTGSDPTMTETRYAIESWFFGASAFPGDYVPVAV